MKLVIGKLKDDEKGVALVVVLMVFVIISILGLAITALAVNNMKMSTRERENQSTYYIAESGITLMESEIKQLAKTSCTNSATNFVNSFVTQTKTYSGSDFPKVYGLQPEAQVTSNITKDAVKGVVNIEMQSHGTIGNNNRTVSKIVQVKCTPGNSESPLTILNDMAVYTNNTIYFSSKIIGNIGTNCVNGNCSSAKPITVDWGAELINPEKSSEFAIINVPNPPNPVTNIYDKPTYMNFLPKVSSISYRPFYGANSPYNPPAFPEYPKLTPKPNILLSGGSSNDLTISSDGYYDQITLQSGRILTINVGTENRKIVVNKLLMEQGFIKITGTGTLTLYVGDEFVFGGYKKGEPTGGGSSSINASGDSDKVNIYYKGNQSFVLGGDIRINGNVYVKNANISLGGSGSIIGNLIAANATKVDITGGSNSTNRFILAPKATVNVSGGATVKGSVISNNFNLTGGATMIFGKMDLTDDVSFYPPSTKSNSTVSVIPLKEVREINN